MITSTQKIAIAGALLGAFTGVVVKKVLEGIRSIEDNAQVPQPVRDAEPHSNEPLRSDDLRIAQNLPL